MTAVEQWINKMWLKKKRERDMLMETSLIVTRQIYFTSSPQRKFLNFKGEKCVGGKQSKERC